MKDKMTAGLLAMIGGGLRATSILPRSDTAGCYVHISECNIWN